MDYAKIYRNLIDKRIAESASGYTEKHHIIPRCLGGSDDSSNLVELTAKEHFIAHLLLTKMYDKGTIEYMKMAHAFSMMLVKGGNQKRYVSSRDYSDLKKTHSEVMSALQSGSGNNQFGKVWIHNLEKRECKLVYKDTELDEGGFFGRVMDFDNHYTNRKCAFCKKSGVMGKLSKYCSIKCRLHERDESRRMYNREEEFLTYYKSTGSMNKSMKLCGIEKGVVGGYYDWAKKVIADSEQCGAINKPSAPNQPEERDAMSITEIAKLVEQYCLDNGVSFEVALYMLRVAALDAENP